jgi:hypothetical protein
MPVYTGAIAQGSDGISYLGCSQRQKIAKLQLSSSTNRLQNAEQELNTASGNLAALNADPNADPGLLATTRTTYDNALRFFHESQAEFNKNFSNTQSWTIERKKKKNTWKSFLSGMFQVNRTSNSDLNIQGDPRVGKVKRGIDGYMSDFRNNFDTFFG